MVPEEVDMNEHSYAGEEQGSKEVTYWFNLEKKLVCYGQYHPICTEQPQLEILKSASTGMFANIYELLMLP